MANRKVSPEDWLRAAFDALTSEGWPGVAVVPLAARLGVTKGSFYSNFESLDSFVSALVRFWEQLGTEQLIEQLDLILDPEARLRRLFETVWERGDHMKIEAAWLAAAVAGDQRVRSTYLRVNRRRLAYTTELYEQLGLAQAAARRLALAAYGSYLGSILLVALEGNTFRSQADLHEHAAELSRLLIPEDSARRKTRQGILST